VKIQVEVLGVETLCSVAYDTDVSEDVSASLKMEVVKFSETLVSYSNIT
jgi:hypothetical protein